MKFDLNDLNPPTRFKHKLGGELTVRVVTLSVGQRIDKACTTRRPEYKRGQRHEIIDIDEIKRQEMIWDHSIVDWKNIEDAEGKPLKCTKENKVKLINESPFFASWVADCVEEVTEQYQKTKEASEKN